MKNASKYLDCRNKQWENVVENLENNLINLLYVKWSLKRKIEMTISVNIIMNWCDI